MIDVFRKKCEDYGISPVIGVILIVALVVILAALVGGIMFGFTDQLDGDSSNAAFELNEQSGSITPITTSESDQYNIIVDGNKTKTILGNSVGKSIQINNASSGSTVQIVNPQTGQVVQEWKIDDETNIGNGNKNNGNKNNDFNLNGLAITVNTSSPNRLVGVETNDTSFLVVDSPKNNGEFKVSWSEGNKTINSDTVISWNSSGTYRVEMGTNYTHPLFIDPGSGIADNQKVVSIERWGDTNYNSLGGSFAYTRPEYDASDTPDISNVNSLEATFTSSTIHNVGNSFNSWDTSNVENMRRTFGGAPKFNGDISSWDTSNARNMSQMFMNANSFNQDISSWDTSSVNNMRQMFEGASSFNQDLSNWNTNKVTNMKRMFYKANNFNGDISGWETSNVTNMKRMFWNTNFNQDISSWDTSSVKKMNFMFHETPFNQDISSWDTSSVTDRTKMEGMFMDSDFNQNISSWCVNQISSKPTNFDEGASFEGETSKQPDWGTTNGC